jgi:MscS family membrane protein
MESVIDDLLLWGVSLKSLVAASGIVFVGFASRRVVAYLFKGVLARQTQRTNVRWDDDLVRLLPGPIAALVQIGLWYCAAVLLALPREPLDIHQFILQGLEVALAVALLWIFFRLIDVLGAALARVSRRTESRLDDQFVPLVRKTLKVIISVTVGVMVVQELGYSVSSLIASLGVGGLALALAAKDTVANVFGSVVVFTDQPFQVGDWIEVEGVEGTVEEVGFRTTQIRRFDNSSVTLPNATFSSQPIINHSRRPQRRITMDIRLTYDTGSQQMQQLLDDLRRLLKHHPGIDQGFHFVNFTAFGESSLELQLYCFTSTTVWTDFLDIREQLLLRIMELVQSHGLQMAFPTRTIHMSQTP